ncbi:endochitinase EP3-like [Impatiens glandulifera]|uniref:endochitinase EP3-like n=1 Tax=Impatiens glandulifera TaxID=253017 RepID=UPI001FB0A326|nr:endochitinase EP3-like [Impatiens glandulifera]
MCINYQTYINYYFPPSIYSNNNSTFLCCKTATMRLQKYCLVLLVTGVLAGALQPAMIMAQNCSTCVADECCGRWGFCGTGEDFCGSGCQQGPCLVPQQPIEEVSISDIVTESFFNGIIGQADATCPGKSFYTRSAFLNALGSYPKFGTDGSVDDSLREIAAFFAHVTHETGHFCYIEEIEGISEDYCDESNTDYPCVPGLGYYGRGPIQLTWNFNYGPAGNSVGFDGLANPGLVASDVTVSFKTALWYWMDIMHTLIMSGQGFGATIRAIDGDLECDGGNAATVNARVGYYLDYCNQFSVEAGDNLYC